MVAFHDITRFTFHKAFNNDLNTLGKVSNLSSPTNIDLIRL